jgi:class 3 adenylate cyclase
LVTDIVSSTRLWAEHESEMAVDLVTHDELVNAAIVAASGRVFKHTGDGMMATFENAAASASAAAEIQRVLGERSWRVPGGIRVRVALHSGSVHERDGDLFGPPVNRLARLLSRSSPGAVIVSDATASLLADGMPDGLDLFEIGRVELRDVGRSEAVYCLVGEQLESIELHEAVDAAGTQVGSLPPIDDDLVGRSAEIAAVLDAIAVHPVVSVVGVGGMGKTRLALETAAAAGLPDGAWWCDLTAATSPEAVPATVLAAVGGRQSAGRSAVECLVDHGHCRGPDRQPPRVSGRVIPTR